MLDDLRAADCDILTLGQYLQPTRHHLPIARHVTPAAFDALGAYARGLGFRHVESGPLVRSSYHAKESFQSLTRQTGGSGPIEPGR